MNYIGSKAKLSEFIISSINKIVGDTQKKTYAELFGGTGIIARKLKTSFSKVIVNDLEHYSYVLLRNYIGNNKSISNHHLIEELNTLNGIEGKIYNQYCSSGEGGRNFFSNENGKKIDAIRIEIQKKYDSDRISEDEYYFALASLLESADKVANTASVYGAYLKHIKKSAQKKLLLEPAEFEIGSGEYQVYKKDANSLIKEIKGDVLYLDPPYNHRQYGANYHLLNTIALYDDFLPRGKTGLRNYERSKYCIKSEAAEQLNNLIENAQFNYIFLSYNNEGIINLNEIEEILSQFGNYYVISFRNYNRFKADKDSNRKYKSQKTTEFLHVLEKR